jgi:uncharacterized protein involved in type VI secretion and phage assembly
MGAAVRGAWGTVADVADPDRRGRVRVRLGQGVTGWLRCLTPAGGATGGFVALPEPGDEVIVLWLGEVPVVLGQLWSDARPVPAAHAEGAPDPGPSDFGARHARGQPARGASGPGANARRLWQSRAGHALILDDSEGAGGVQLRDRSGRLLLALDAQSERIIVASGRGDLHLRAGGDVVVEAGGAVRLVGHQALQLETDGDASVRARGRAAVSASAELTLQGEAGLHAEGARVRVVAQGPLELEGVAVAVRGRQQVALSGVSAVTVRGAMVAIN